METFKKILSKYYLFVVLFITILFFTIMSPAFLSLRNLINIFVQNAYMVIATVGIMLIMISGGADLSVSYQIGVNACIMGLMMANGISTPMVIVAALVCGLALGFINGIITVTLKVHPMVTTLATMSIFQGMAYIICKGITFSGFPESFKAIGQHYLWGKLPISVIIMFVMVILAHVMLKYTNFGRYIYALGGNEEAAYLAGINTVRMRVLTFAVSSIFVAVASIVFTSRIGSASPTLASDAVFTCFSACVLGGISFRGGEGNVVGVVLGVFIFGLLSNGMQLIGLSIYGQYVVKGILLILAISFDNYQKASRVKKAAKS